MQAGNVINSLCLAAFWPPGHHSYRGFRGTRGIRGIWWCTGRFIQTSFFQWDTYRLRIKQKNSAKSWYKNNFYGSTTVKIKIQKYLRLHRAVDTPGTYKLHCREDISRKIRPFQTL